MDTLRMLARAKINLGLDVLRRREDGYHEVKMVMQTVDICDRLEFDRLSEDRILIVSDHQELPADGSNLIYRAAALMKEAYGISDGISVKLEKNIPIAAGMAGGSADAAATIHGMAELFNLKLSLEEKQKLGVKLGADVPYCLMGGTALSEGIGEVLTALPAVPPAFLVVAKPDIDVSTKFVYENLHVDGLRRHPDIDGMVEGIRRGNLREITDRMENVLETVTVRKYPVIEEMKTCLREQGAMNALMSGSGPTVFGIFEDKKRAAGAYEAMKRRGFAKRIYLTGFAE